MRGAHGLDVRSDKRREMELQEHSFLEYITSIEPIQLGILILWPILLVLLVLLVLLERREVSIVEKWQALVQGAGIESLEVPSYEFPLFEVPLVEQHEAPFLER